MHKAGGVFQRIDQQVIEEKLAFGADIDDGGQAFDQQFVHTVNSSVSRVVISLRSLKSRPAISSRVSGDSLASTPSGKESERPMCCTP